MTDTVTPSQIFYHLGFVDKRNNFMQGRWLQRQTAYENLCDELADELLARLRKTSPVFSDLVVKMCDAGSHLDIGKVLGPSGEVGIDGIIKKDKM